ncbi:exonuclease domain-containing protein [Rothia halotolerans]|uniref:exonuclease domain-containing protein n=1 Tax=Rothia halotolerans TaxID=405770 RepID=UPI0013EDDE21|nr:exonuclease domain-containing protein [Rothia halotolerans]
MASPPLDFVAIDFETANADKASVCQVGVVKVLGGEMASIQSWYVRPPTGLTSFDPENIGIHGIKPKDVLKAGIEWAESVERLEKLCAGLPLIAHNAAFDRGVFEAACRMTGVETPSWRWEDTLKISREYLDLPNHKLPTVAEHLRLPRFMHHDAAADAQACALVTMGIARLVDATHVDDLWPAPRVSTGRGPSARWFDKAAKAKVSELPQPSPEADPEHPLHGQMVAVTGDVPGMTRWELFEAIAAAGGTPQKSVTLKTTLLVAADHADLTEGYDPASGSAKEKKGHEYQQRGKPIRFIGRLEFEECLDWSPQRPQEDVGSVASVALPTPASPASREVRPESGDLMLPERIAESGVLSLEEEPRADERQVLESPGLLGDKVGTEQLDDSAPAYLAVESPDPAGPSESPQSPAGTIRMTTPAPEASPRTSEFSEPTVSVVSEGGQRPLEGAAIREGSEARTVHNPAEPGGGASRLLRRIFGWIVLVPSALFGILYLVLIIFGLITDPPETVVTLGVIVLSLFVTAVFAVLCWLGMYLIWFRDRRRRAVVTGREGTRTGAAEG